MQRSPKQQVRHFLSTGEADPLPHGWPGENWLVKAQNADRAMKDALILEVKLRADGLPSPAAPLPDCHRFTRSKVDPMVNGLFPEHERTNVLEMLERSVTFLTGENILDVLLRSKLKTSWKLANIYLSSIGGNKLSKKAECIVGLSEEINCYVSHEYFHQQNRFADFVVHEAAHVFHNCKRLSVGLPENRTKEFLLNIEYCQRETFAYACEVYSRILEIAANRKERIKLAEEVEDEFVPPDDRVDLDKFYAALAAASAAKNGWSKILQFCAPAKRQARKPEREPLR
jgi:hypothetical protein